MHVRVVVHGTAHFGTVVGTGPRGHVTVHPFGLPCGVYPIVVNDQPNTRAVRPVMRIWVIRGGKRIDRIGFPLPEPPIGLSFKRAS
jgi:hypothetical protein